MFSRHFVAAFLTVAILVTVAYLHYAPSANAGGFTIPSPPAPLVTPAPYPPLPEQDIGTPALPDTAMR